MSKELEASKRIREELARHHYKIDDIYRWSAIEDDLDIIEDALKALEIIKNKKERKMIKVFLLTYLFAVVNVGLLRLAGDTNNQAIIKGMVLFVVVFVTSLLIFCWEEKGIKNENS